MKYLPGINLMNLIIMKIPFLVLTVDVLIGCTTPSAIFTGVEPEVRKAAAVKTICISSVPSGCIVELNGEYIGQTPFSLTVDADINGCWPRHFQNGELRAFSNRFVCTTPNGFSDSRYWAAGNRIQDIVLFRPLVWYPDRQSRQLNMNVGS